MDIFTNEEGLRVTLESIGDAVIATDAEGRVVFLNPVAQSLTGWGNEEAHGQPLACVFRIVNEHTRQEAENPATRALREGAVVGLATHTILVARDGTERPIEDSAAPIKDDQGGIVGVILVFHDVTERRRAERLAEDARLHAEGVVETVREPLLVLDGQLRVRTANRSFYLTFGVRPEETGGRLLYDLGDGQWDIPALRQLLGEILPRNTVFNDFEVAHDFPGLGRKVMLLNARKLYRAGNHTELILLAIEDITERRRDERLAQDALAYAEAIVATVREPLVVLGGDLRVRTANRSFYQAFGVKPEETEGRLLYDLGDRQWDIPALRKLLEGILPQNTSFEGFEVDHDFPGLGRKVMLLNARKLYREGNHTELILLAIEDVTAQRREEAARRELETRYTSLVRNIRDHSIFMMDPTGHVASWNVEAERIMGYSEGEILGRHFSVIFTPEDIERGLPEQELRLAREDGRAEDERWHVRKDGTRFWALGIVTPMLDAGGTLTGYSKILRDMTDRKRAEQLLHRQSEALKEADRRKDEFLAMLSHELRNPMAPIRNAAQVIRLVRPVEPNIERAAEMMGRQVGVMARLVDDLLEVSRITTGKVRLQTEPVELAAVVARAVETSRPLIDRRRQALTVSLCPEPVSVDGDVTRLAQVVANLLNNASKFTDEGGHINVTVERQGDRGVVRVRDDGMGIPADVLPHVFDLFRQGDRTLARSEGGLGIGLSLVRNLVEMHGGRVEAFSDGVGKGSEFVVQFPALETQPLAPAGDDGIRANRTPVLPRSVLVVDDNVDAAESLAMLLRVEGHEVRTAYDGPTALEAAQAFPPEVAFIDIGLPRMDGCEVARRLREQAGTEDALLVALTGYGQEEDRRRSLEAGFAAHLVKPADPAALAKLLARSRPETPERKEARP